MAYNYFPVGYQPMQYQQAQANYFQGGNGSGIVWVQGEGAAKSYPVAPNTSIPLFDAEANVIYIKSADASGMPSIKVLDYSIRDNTPRTPEIGAQADFATKSEVLSMKQELEALKAEFQRLTNAAEVTHGE